MADEPQGVPQFEAMGAPVAGNETGAATRKVTVLAPAERTRQTEQSQGGNHRNGAENDWPEQG